MKSEIQIHTHRDRAAAMDAVRFLRKNYLLDGEHVSIVQIGEKAHAVVATRRGGVRNSKRPFARRRVDTLHCLVDDFWRGKFGLG